MSAIYISYRREDSASEAGLIHDQLSRQFGPHTVRQNTLEWCETLLSVIGPGWLSAVNGRCHSVDDHLRTEVESALARKLNVVPVLIRGARIPEAPLLPRSLTPMLRLQSVTLRQESFNADLRYLAQVIQGKQFSANGRHVIASAPTLSSAVRDELRHDLTLLEKYSRQIESTGVAGTPYSQFVNLRAEIVTTLRGAGLSDQALQVAKLAAPTLIREEHVRAVYEIRGSQRVLTEITR